MPPLVLERFANRAKPRNELLLDGFQSYGPLVGPGKGLFWDLATQAEKDKGAASGAALSDGSYLITACEGPNSVDTAVHAVGRGGNNSHETIRKHIMKRADSLGCSSKIPDTWNADGSLKAGALATDDTAGGEDADITVDTTVKAIGDAIAAAKSAQSKDPDDATDANDEKVDALLDQLDTTYQELVKAQGTDEANDTDSSVGSGDAAGDATKSQMANSPNGGPPAVAADDPSKKAKAPSAMVDDDGNIDPDAVCTVPDCQHVASVHEDTDQGENTGSCSTPGCDCTGMTVDTSNSSDTGGDSDDGVDEGEDNANGDSDPANKFAGVDTAVVPPIMDASAPKPPIATDDLNAPPELQLDTTKLGQPWYAVLIVEGQQTGDGRQIQSGALTWRTLPIPLMGLATETHDPTGLDTNDPAVICGVIESIERVAGESSTQLIVARGHFLADEDGEYFASKVSQMGRLGVSADVAATDTSIVVTETDEAGFPSSFDESLDAGVLLGSTVLPFAAFNSCYIMLGDGPEGGVQPTPVPIPAASGMAASSRPMGPIVKWLAFSECVPCTNTNVAIVASAAPTRPPKAWFENPGYVDGDDRLIELRGKNGAGAFAAPLRLVNDQGRMQGHVAPFGVCHLGFPGQCITTPRSKTGYAYFMRAGQEIMTAEGDLVRVGVITMDTNHAPIRGRGATPTNALAHYDNTGLIIAYGVVGEDKYGVWFSGVLAPNVTEEQIQRFRMTTPSGDWRKLAGGDEMVAVLMVNSPGLPQAAMSNGGVEALVAAGAMVMHNLTHEPEVADDGLGDMPTWAKQTLLAARRQQSRDRIAALVP